MQIVIKLFLTLFLIYIGCRIWKTDIDITKLRPDKLFKKKAEEIVAQLPHREKDALYQNDNIVAKVKDGKYQEANGEINFEQLEYCNDLDINKPFQFQRYVLKIRHIDTMIGLSSSQPQKGRILQKVYCIILRKR